MQHFHARNRASLEFLSVEVKSNITLSTQPIEMALTPQRVQPIEDDWRSATWLGTPSTTRQARLLLDDSDLAVGKWSLWLRVTDSPEIPVIEVDSIVIT